MVISRRTLYSAIIAILIVSGFILVASMQHDNEAETANDVKAVNAREEPVEIQPVPVRVGTAFMGELRRRVAATGNTEAIREVELRAGLTAQVKRSYVDEGMCVSKGDLLIELDDQEYRFAVQEAYVKMMNARLEYALMKKEQLTSVPDSVDGGELEHLRDAFEAAQDDYRAGRITIEEYLEIDRKYQIEKILSGRAREELMAQKSGLTAAEADYARADYNLKCCRITAQFDGIVGTVAIQTGDLVTANQELIRLVDLSKLKLILEVMEGDVQYVREGESVRVHFMAFPDTVFTGQINGISPIVDQKRRTCKILSEIDNPKGTLKSGMYANAEIVVSRHKNRLLVPRDAVIVRDQKKLVFIVRDNRACWCYVETGLENDEYIEIKSSTFDLQPGEQVIVEGHFALAHNAPIEIMEHSIDWDNADQP